MLIVALKDCPQDQRAGTIFEVPDAAAHILITAGAARKAEPGEEASSATGEQPPKRRYRRRDLTAEP